MVIATPATRLASCNRHNHPPRNFSLAPRRLVWLAGSALLFSASLLLPQNLWAQRGRIPPPPKQQDNGVQFRTAVNRVIVDVVVTDKNGKRVHGLTQRDFSVAEDKVPQRMVAFDVHDFDSVSESLPPNLPPLPVNTFLNLPAVPERGPLYVFLLDLVNTDTDDQMWARQQLLKFVDSKPSGTRFEAYSISDGVHLVQGFTSDRKLLFAALDPKHPKSHIPKVFLYGRNYGKNDPALMVAVFNYIAQQLEGLPGRKNLIWMAKNFPMSTGPIEGTAYDLSEETKHAVDAMARSQVAVYTIAACGISPDDPTCGGSSNVGGVNAGGTGPLYDAAIATDVATQTGGKRYVTNDFKDELADATEDGANYYSITYAPANQSYDGKQRHITVKLNKRNQERDYTLAYRRSYFAEDPNAPPVEKVSSKDEPPPPPPRKPGDSLVANMEYGAPMAHQMIFRAHVQALGTPALGTPEQMANLSQQPAYFQLRRKNRPLKPLKPIELQTYAIDYLVMLPKANTGDRPVALEFATAAFDADGQMLNGLVENGTRSPDEAKPTGPQGSGPSSSASPSGEASGNAGQNATTGNNEKGLFRAQLQIDVPRVATAIRVAVRDMNTDRIGAIEVTLPLAPEGPARAAAPTSPQAAEPTPARPE